MSRELGSVRSQAVATAREKGLGKLGRLFDHNWLPLHAVLAEVISSVHLRGGSGKDAHGGTAQFLGALDAEVLADQKSLSIVKIDLTEIEAVYGRAGEGLSGI